jgi:hypothetical protein
MYVGGIGADMACTVTGVEMVSWRLPVIPWLFPVVVWNWK